MKPRIHACVASTDYWCACARRRAGKAVLGRVHQTIWCCPRPAAPVGSDATSGPSTCTTILTGRPPHAARLHGRRRAGPVDGSGAPARAPVRRRPRRSAAPSATRSRSPREAPTTYRLSLADCTAAPWKNDKDFFRRHFDGKVVLIGTLLDVEDRKITQNVLPPRPKARGTLRADRASVRSGVRPRLAIRRVRPGHGGEQSYPGRRAV